MRNMKFLAISITLLFAFNTTITNPDNFKIKQVYNLAWSGTFETGGDGYPDKEINWINIDETFEDNVWLKNNHGNYKVAILDTGLDEGTYLNIMNQYSDYIDLTAYDRRGYPLAPWDLVDWLDVFHHGSFITSLVVQLLERDAGDVYAQIDVYTIADENGLVDSDLVYNQLNRIKNWNINHPNNKYKVITTSFQQTGTEPDYIDLIDYLVNQQDCIFIAASGNYAYEYWKSGDARNENTLFWPSRASYVIGVGGIYGYRVPTGYESKKINRMTTVDGFETGDSYLGSCYKDDRPLQQASVDLVAPGFKVEGFFDLDGDTNVENYITTGTSFASPQVAVAAYLASRAKYYLNPSNPILTYDDFYSCIYQSCENDPEGRDLPTSERRYSDTAGEPVANYGTYQVYFTYRVGYGSLDIYDMIEYIYILS
ncbi:MAG: S8/S53 family peptidase [Candidatus Heimdallarchaeaceae archaeon]